MKRSTIASVIAVMTMLQSVSYAQITDLPDPGQGGTTTLPTLPPAGGSTQETEYAGATRIGAVSRKTGGERYTVKLQNAISLKRIDIRVAQARVKIYEMTLVSQNGQRLQVQQLTNTAVLETNTVTSSENLDESMLISSIELMAESFSSEADIVVTAVSGSELPKLSLQASAVTTTPQNPTTTAPTVPVTPPPGVGGNTGIGGPIPTVPVPPGTIGGAFFIGEQVLYNSQVLVTVTNIRGEQVEIYEDGRGNRTVFASILEKSTRCYGDICQGDTLTYLGQPVQILKAFNSGFVVINSGFTTNMVIEAYKLSKQTQQPSMQCDAFRSFCVGDSIMYGNQYTGTITQVFGNSTVEIVLHGNNMLYTVYTDQLASALRCSISGESVCVNERVFVQGRGALVMGIYSNGLARVIFDGQRSESIVPSATLSKRGAVVVDQSQFYVGQRVKYQNRTVTIKAIYNNGTARISSGTLFGSDSIVNLTDLRR